MRWWAARSGAESVAYLFQRNGDLAESDTVVGFGLVRLAEDRWWITGGLAPEHRGRGLGTQLFEFLSGLHGETWLKVRAWNGVARKLYVRLGFLPVGVEGDVITMVRRCP